jgi:peptidoglycan/xylan/chitin deacetylase (PgdA/CDA1 family)
VSARALVLAYHAIESGPSPLCIEPSLLREHLDLIGEAPVRVLSLDQLVEEARSEGPLEPGVAVTFDDGFASVAEQAAPLLLERGIPATVFCVAGHLGGVNDFASDSPGSPKRRLAGVGTLRELVAGGFELGSHGTAHLPLEQADGDEELLRREIVDSRLALEELLGCPVRWFAHPYGSPPGPRGRALIEGNYTGACAHGLRTVQTGDDRYALPRVDAHYLRRPALLRRALEGDALYLRLRRFGARARRMVRRDFVRKPG